MKRITVEDFPEEKVLFQYGRCVKCGQENYLDHNGCCPEEECYKMSIDLDEKWYAGRNK